MITDKQIYQFGTYVFKRLNLSTSWSRGVKTQYETAVNMQGDSRKNGVERSKFTSNTLTIQFFAEEGDDLDQINKQFFSGVQKIYFVQEYDRANGLIRFLVNYAECLSLNQEYDSTDGSGSKLKRLKAELKLLFPFNYEVTDGDLVYVDTSAADTLRYDTGLTYDSGRQYDLFYVNSRKSLQSLTIQQKRSMFAFEGDDAVVKPQHPLEWIDRFLLYKEYTNKTFNYLTNTENLASSSWTRTNTTITLNQAQYLTYNTDAQKMPANSAAATISVMQSGLSIPIGVLVFAVDLKLDAASSVSQFRIVVDWNGAATSANSGLRSFAAVSQTTSGATNGTYEARNLGNGWFRCIFRITNYSTQFNDVRVTLRYQSVTTSDAIYIKNISFYNENIVGTSVDYQPNIVASYGYFNSQNSLVYTLTSNSAVNLYTYPIDLSGSEDNRNLLVRISSLSLNDSLTIRCFETNSGFTLTWLSNTASPELLYDVLKGQLYNATNGQVISAYDGNYSLIPLPVTLFLPSTLTTVQSEPLSPQSIIQVQKSGSSNITFALKNYKTYV